MWKLLVWSIPISMLAGLLYGTRFDSAALKQLIIPVTFIMVYPMMATLNVQSVFKGKDTRLQLSTQVINFVVIPLVAYLIGKVFFANGVEKYGLWAVGLFLIGVLPTSGMTISWTGFAKGNVAGPQCAQRQDVTIHQLEAQDNGAVQAAADHRGGGQSR